VSGIRPPLRPQPSSRGLASVDPADVATLISAAWGATIELVDRLDLDQPSRLPDWTVRDVLVHLGTWSEHARFERLLDDARHGRCPPTDDVHARNALVVAAHRDAGREDISTALAVARDRALEFLASDEAERLGREPAPSPVGPLPVTCVIAATAYELAVHALDVAAATDVPSGLLDAAIGALVDTTGALAARSGVRASFAVLTPLGGWAGGSEQDSWTTTRIGSEVPVGELGWPTVQGEAADVLDASAGRRPAVQLILTRRLRLHDVAGLMTLLPALESVPGLPGGVALRATARALGRTGQIVGRISTTIRQNSPF
jgi:uncharacterized protein (TIGR03083 family)